MYIYTLANPITKEIRYVGKTERRLDVRKREHKSVSKKIHTHLATWIRSLSSDPVMETLEEVGSVEELNDAERFLISQFRNWGFRLVNHTDGGEGVSGWHHSEETKACMSSANAGKIFNPKLDEAREKAMLAVRGRKQTDSERLVRSKSGGGKPFRDQYYNIYQIQKETARKLGIPQGSISNCLSGKSRHASGYIFTYLEDNLVLGEH